MSKLAGKRVLVTGGGSGIGLATARMCLAEGAAVAITGRDEAKLRAAAGDQLVYCAADLTDPAQAHRMVEEVTSRLGGIDVLVNNAGMNIKERLFRELTPESWRRLVAGNLDGAFHCMLAVLPQMRQRKDGLIINVNSISGKRASPLGGTGYIAAKFGLRGLAMGVAAEERANNIRVCSIYPGEVNTPILEARPEPVSDERKQAMLQPEDVAAAVLFVAALPPHVAVPELILTPANALYL
jgi:NAD(P)-dependent dehydrogenase (short-subunit alcohol dehydrogenase family)